MTLGGPSEKNSVGSKRGNSEPPSKGKPSKKGKVNLTTKEGKEDKSQLIELRQKLRDTELLLQSAQDRIKRLEGQEAHMEKSYEDLKNKNDEDLDGHDDLRNLKLVTFNHFLAKWENVNEDKDPGDISQLNNAFPVTLRGYFTKEIEENKDILN